jgi:hypothetical protein
MHGVTNVVLTDAQIVRKNGKLSDLRLLVLNWLIIRLKCLR